jgi:hypothetical protein
MEREWRENGERMEREWREPTKENCEMKLGGLPRYRTQTVPYLT